MWQMLKLHLKAGIPQLMDGVMERGAVIQRSLAVQRLSAPSQSVQMQMSHSPEAQRQSLSDRYLYPLMRMSLLLAVLLLEALARLPQQVRQLSPRLAARLQSRLDQYRYRLMQMYHRRVTRLRLAWDRLQLLKEKELPYHRQELASLVQRVGLMFGGWLIQAKHQAGQILVTVKRQIGQKLAAVKHQIGKR